MTPADITRSRILKAGHQIGLADAWIAASPLVPDCALATNNGKDFQGIVGLELISPGFE